MVGMADLWRFEVMMKAKVVRTGIANMRPGKANKIVKNNLILLGRSWYDTYYAIRFTNAGQNKYHMKRRGKRYVRKAKRINPSWVPLVLTGRLKSISLSGATVRGISKAGSATTKVSIKRPHATPRYVSQELVKINKMELSQLLRQYKNNLIKDLGKK